MHKAISVRRYEPFWLSRVFWVVLGLKVFASAFFASEYMTQLFTPFVNWFVVFKFHNPWDFFYNLHMVRMFPYPTVMLWVMAVPRYLLSGFLSTDWTQVTPVHLLIMRLPILVFDVLLLSLFMNIFSSQARRVLFIFWCSPIVFFINYVHGQLDIIPTAIFFFGVHLLISGRYLQATLLLAASAASKTHVLICMPFILVFLYKNRIGLRRLAGYSVLFAVVYFLLISPYIGSVAFREMVFNSPEQKKLFEFVMPISPNMHVIVCPTVLFLLFIQFVSHKRLNREVLLMFLGIVFVALVVFVPPMPGWFMWSLPYLIYFYMHNKEYSRAPFVVYNIIYLVYFLFFFEGKSILIEKMFGIFPIKDLALSIIISSLGFIGLWMFNLGNRKNKEFQMAEAPMLIGIGGDSASGKHTLLQILSDLVGRQRAIPIFGDNFHKWERGNDHWNVYTHLDPSANRLHQSMHMAIALKDGQTIEMVQYDHVTGKFTNPKLLGPNKFIFFVGLHPFYLKRMRDMMPIKIFLDTDEKLRKHWKLQRDVCKRGYDKSKVMDQIVVRQLDKIKYVEPQKAFADLLIQYSVAGDSELTHSAEAVLPLITRYTMDNSVNLEPLVTELMKIETLRVKHASTVDDQELVIQGKISAHEVRRIAYGIEVNSNDILIHSRRWHSNQDGITQIVFLLLHYHKMKDL